MADSKRESREVKLIGLEHNTSDLDWGLYALAENGVKYAISESEYVRLSEERQATGGIPTLDYSQVLFVKTDDGSTACVKCAEKEDNTSNLTVTVTADVNDAITGFKSLSRELREATKAARELEQAYEDVEHTVNDISTQLVRDDRLLGRIYSKLQSKHAVEVDGKKIGTGDFGISTYRDLSEVTTKELLEELSKRTGVKEYVVSPVNSYAEIVAKTEHGLSSVIIEGYARILVIKD